ncbi:hypothetical protein CEXT_615071 [Caerostris extrusa]|uniref:Uncharacterized protein n=1 Tax=Caerostris extrusa TaxID=172846 RepID=A0AAV4NFN0_CAEEX|nr:hypothetical protein CEXT_615071 [Caerostris extrusa]
MRVLFVKLDNIHVRYVHQKKKKMKLNYVCGRRKKKIAQVLRVLINGFGTGSKAAKTVDPITYISDYRRHNNEDECVTQGFPLLS